MPQTALQILSGYASVTIDTLIQKFVNPSFHPHPIFCLQPYYLSNQTAIVTGSNTGIGLQTARMLAAAGAHVILACRNSRKAENAATHIRSSVPTASLQIEILDLSDLQSVRRFAAVIEDRPCHMLILNAGVMAVPPEVPETHFMVNHAAHALLCLLLIRNIASVHGRIVFVSSLTLFVSNLHLQDIAFQTRPYNWMTAYANSKLAMYMFMRALHKRVRHAVVVNAVHPGEATSDVARYIGGIWMTLHKKVGSLFLLSPEQSARTSVFVAGAKEMLHGGSMFHRIDKLLSIPSRFQTESQIEHLWRLTLESANVSEGDLSALNQLIPP